LIRIRKEFPPNYDAIRATFKLDGRQPIFAFAPDIFNPHGTPVGPELVEHERIHILRQGDDPSAWWGRYIAEDNFRLAEEVFAHVAEYYVLVQRCPDRPTRRRLIDAIAERLADPLYGYTPPLSQERAKKILKWALRQEARSRIVPYEGETP
jgi:hypothetical protein